MRVFQLRMDPQVMVVNLDNEEAVLDRGLRSTGSPAVSGVQDLPRSPRRPLLMYTLHCTSKVDVDHERGTYAPALVAR